MARKSVQFKDVEIGQEFICNGLRAVKQSSRTGYIPLHPVTAAALGTPKGKGRVFYWGQKEQCTVEE
jgi:hypothetical protein